MGGFGTLIHALSKPEKYAALGAFSAAVSVVGRFPDADTEENDPLTAAKKNVKAGKKLPKMYIACGNKDFLYDANVKFRDEMKALGADVTWIENPAYGHEWRFWNEQIEAYLDWLAPVRTDTFAGNGKRQI